MTAGPAAFCSSEAGKVLWFFREQPGKGLPRCRQPGRQRPANCQSLVSMAAASRSLRASGVYPVSVRCMKSSTVMFWAGTFSK